MAMLRDNRHQMTLQMVHHNLDTRHVTMRRFPMKWISNPATFLHTAMGLSTQFGEVVEIVDVSDQQRRQDDDRKGERTLEVKYLHAESGIRAVRGLGGQDIRSNREQRSVGWAPPRKEHKFVCLITGSPVVIEHCDCDDGADCNALCRIVWRPIRCPCSFRWRRPPPVNKMEPDHNMEPLVAALFEDRAACPLWGTHQGCKKGRKCSMMHDGATDTHPRTSLSPTHSCMKYLLKNSFQLFEFI